MLALSGCAKNDVAKDQARTRIRRPESSVMEPAQPDDSRVRRRAVLGVPRVLEPADEREKGDERQDAMTSEDGDSAGGDSASGQQDGQLAGEGPTGEGGEKTADGEKGDGQSDAANSEGSGDANASSDLPTGGGDDGENAPPATPPVTVVVAEGTLQLLAPAGWQQVEPAINMIEAEFAIPGEAEDAPKGRATVMGAMGGVEANINRWIGQLTQPDGADSADVAKIEQSEVNGCPVHVVDISGTYMDGMGGPNAPQVERPGYRLLGAIIETPEQGDYFVKFYGPEPLVAAHVDGFKAMIAGLKIVE